MPAPTPRSIARRAEPDARAGDQRPRAGHSCRGSEARCRGAHPLFDRLRVRRNAHDAVSGRRADRAAERLRTRASSKASARSRPSARARIVLRTSWVYGLRGKNFLLTIRKLAAERDELTIVADQIGVPNWSRALAAATARIVGAGLPALAERSGLYHLSCSGRGELVRLRARDRRRCRETADRADHDRRISDAGASAGVRRPRDVALRVDVRLRAAGLAASAGGLRRESGGAFAGVTAASGERSRARQNANDSLDVHPDGQRAALAGDDDRVHAERDAAERARPSDRCRAFAAARRRSAANPGRSS